MYLGAIMTAKQKKLWALSLLGALTGTTLISLHGASAATEDSWRCKRDEAQSGTYGMRGCEFEQYPVRPSDPNGTGGQPSPAPGPSPSPGPYAAGA